MEVKTYVAPDNLNEVYGLLKEDAFNKIIAGGAWAKISLKKVNKLISLDNCGLRYIKESNSYFEIGAMTTLREIETNPGINSLANGILPIAISNIMGIGIRNLATIGGSVMGKYAFSDILGVLLVLDAKLTFFDLGEITILDFLKMKKIPEDILVNIKLPKNNLKGYFKKVSKTHLDFAVINIAIVKGEVFKIAVGSRPKIAALAIDTANFLNSNKEITEEVIKQAQEIIVNEIDLQDNVRGSKEYRKILLETYLKRGLKEVLR
jgi:CO/xanthine dehydrogenase FAD-binding subunit